MKIEVNDKLESKLDWLLKLVAGAMLTFITMGVNHIWTNWDEHQKEDRSTQTQVTEMKTTVKTQGENLNYLTGRVNTISDHYVSK